MIQKEWSKSAGMSLTREDSALLAMNVSRIIITVETDCCLDWTIMDQIAVAALITGNDVLAKVPLTRRKWRLPFRTVLTEYRHSFPSHPEPMLSWECNLKRKRSSPKLQNTMT